MSAPLELTAAVPSAKATPLRSWMHTAAGRWAITVSVGVALWLLPPPASITSQSWTFVALFAGTIVGFALQPLPGGAIVLLGIVAMSVTSAAPLSALLSAYSDALVWCVLCAFFMARALFKTGLGRRCALFFVRLLGGSALGVGVALGSTAFLLGGAIPSTSARAGGIVFPIARSIAQTCHGGRDAEPNRLGAFLMLLLYQCEVVTCATWFTGAASNALMANLVRDLTGVTLGYTQWIVNASLPSLVSLALVGWVVYRACPPGVRGTEAARELARTQLDEMGPMARDERITLAIFVGVALTWVTAPWHGLHAAAVAFAGVAALLVTRVLEWDDVRSERDGWDVFIWYGGLVAMAGILRDTGITALAAERIAGALHGLSWPLITAGLVLGYIGIHYAFASITAHAAAMFTPFLAAMLAASAPTGLAILLLVYASNVMACATHYGTTSGPIYFGAGYVSQRTWWRIGAMCLLLHIGVWGTLGPLWWRLLGVW